MTVVSLPSVPVRTARTRRWLRRIGLALPVAVAAAYALLPWYLPTNWLARRLADAIGADLSREVGIDRVSVSWAEGIRVSGLHVHDRPGAGRPPLLLQIDRVQCAFSPFQTLVTGRVDRLEIEGLRLWVSELPDGRLNIADLGGRGQAGLPTFIYGARDVGLHLDLPGFPAYCHMDLASCRLEPATGLLRIHGDVTIRPNAARAPPTATTRPAGRFWVDGRLQVPRLKRGIKLTGGGELRWENVDLRELPFDRLPMLGLKSVEGRTDGRLRLETFPDLHVDYDLDVRLDGVAIRRAARTHPERIQDGALAAAGRWDPAADLLVVQTLDYRMPALRIHGIRETGRPAVILDRDAAEPLRAEIAGEVTDMDRLRRQLPAIDEAMRRCGLHAGPGGRFTLTFSQTVDAVSARLALDAHAVAISCRDHMQLPAGVPKRLLVDASRTADGRVRIHEARLDVDELHAACEASLPELPLSDPSRSLDRASLLREMTFKLRLATPRAGQLARYFPGVDRRLGAGRRDGAFECSASFEPSPEGRAFRVDIRAPAGAELEWRDYLRKPADLSLTAAVGGVWNMTRPQHLSDLEAAFALGRSRITLDGAKARVELDEGERVHLPFAVAGIEGLLEHMPFLASRLRAGEWAAGPAELSGDAELVVDAALTRRDDRLDWLAAVQVDLTDARIRAEPWLRKDAGDPASLAASHKLRRDADRVRHDVRLRADVPGAGIEALGSASGPPGPALYIDAITERTATMDIRVSDAERLLAGMPFLSRRLSGWGLAGQASSRIAVAGTGPRESLATMVNVDGLRFAAPSRAFTKEAGVSCGAEVRLHAQGQGTRAWAIDAGSARLASCRFDCKAGDVQLGEAWATWLDAVRSAIDDRLREALAGRPTAGRPLPPLPSAGPIEHGTVAGDIRVEAGSDLRSLAPAVDAWVSRLAFVGEVRGPVRMALAPESTRLTATVDATQAHVGVPLPDKTRFAKPVGLDSSLVIDVEAVHPQPDGEASALPRIVIRKATLSAQGNQIDLNGDVGLDPAESGRLRVALAVPRLDRMQALFPGHAWPPARGEVVANASLGRDEGRWRVESSDVTLRDVALTIDDVPVHLAGRIESADGGVLVDSLAVRAGAGRLTLSGQAAPGESPAIRIGLHAPRLDVDEVRQIASAVLQREVLPKSAGASRSGRAFWDWLGRANLDVWTEVDRMQLTIPGMGVRSDLQATNIGVSARDGVVEMPFQLAVDGGVTVGRIKFLLREAEPYFDLTYSCEGIGPKALSQAYLRKSFPGFVATGPVTLIDRSLQRLFPRPGEPNHPVGSGELIIDGGHVVGKAAPDWLVRIFPGLNLTKYEFLRMHDWFTKHADGRADHRMIFQGRYYHVYMEGWTDADRNVRYEVGIDLLARLDSKYWVETQQGRIPLFVKTGRLRDDGTLDPDEVSFTPMRRVVETLAVQTNPAITAYYAIRKQMLNLMEKRRGVP